LGPYLSHVHCKNAAWVENGSSKSEKHWVPSVVPMKDGFISWAEFLTALDKVGYGGWLSFEDLAQATRPRSSLTIWPISRASKHGLASKQFAPMSLYSAGLSSEAYRRTVRRFDTLRYSAQTGLCKSNAVDYLGTASI